MATVPAVTPITDPLKDPTVAMVTSLLVHDPPGVKSLRVVLAPMQAVAEPVIGAVLDRMVNVSVAFALQPAVVPVMVYTVVMVGLAFTVAPVEADKVAAGVQVYVVAPDAVRAAGPVPEQKLLFVAKTVGMALTVKVNDCAVPGQVLAVGVTLNTALPVAPVKEEIFPVPEPELKPMEVLLLVQE